MPSNGFAAPKLSGVDSWPFTSVTSFTSTVCPACRPTPTVALSNTLNWKSNVPFAGAPFCLIWAWYVIVPSMFAASARPPARISTHR